MEIQAITADEGKSRVQVAIMASGRGSNAEAIIQYSKEPGIAYRVALIVTNNPNAGVIGIAQHYGIPWCCVDPKDYQNAGEYDDYLLEVFRRYRISMIALAGYLKLIPLKIINSFPQKIFNIHPSLLPKYGGNGMYGLRVHKKVIENREQISGSSVHIVEPDYDTGEILAQQSVEVLNDDTPETLAERVLQIEYLIYPPVLNRQAEQILRGM
ncbi:MAG: phosphoribosylglycinamide formyltransferase [Candidatus Kapaibacterium sp.]